MTILKIAFGCQSRVGKDEACKILQEKYKGEILHFSDPLYEIMYKSQEIAGLKKQKEPKFLQWIGTEWGRKINDNIWINNLISRITPNKNTFIGDVRFVNEFNMLKKEGFICIRIIKENKLIDRDITHISENELIDKNIKWDYIINNDSSLENFHYKVINLIEKILN